MRRWWLLVSLSACDPSPTAPPEPAADPVAKAEPAVEPPSAPESEPRPDAPSREAPAPEPEPEPAPVGCWERTFGKPPSSDGRSFDGPVPGCEGCEELRAGPLAAGLQPEVLTRLLALQRGLPPPAVAEPLLWINSGKRDGPPAASMHNQGLAVDVVICGLDTRETAEHLREAGFSCVIEYFDGDGNPCNMAHGDLRGTTGALGAYAPGGRKSRSCPRKAVSRDASCQNQAKGEWKYEASQG